jgi:hypothetical protein
MRHSLSLYLVAFCLAASACQSSTPSSAGSADAAPSTAPTVLGAAAAPAGSVGSTNAGRGASLDNVRKGMGYADFRTALMSDGWKPMADAKCMANVVGADYKAQCAKNSDSCKACDDLPELSACSGDAVCVMRFRDARTDRQLDVSTYGDITDRKVQGNDSQLDVTGWQVSPLPHANQ